MTTIKILSVFDNYLKTPGTTYALLINGTWGCGKTHFWKSEMVSTATKNSFKCIYVSLNGISSIADLNQAIFVKTIPLLNNDKNRWSKKFECSTSALLALAKKYNISNLIQEVATDFIDFNKYVICFDDLERCQLPFKVVLGFINDYVEHKNLKTIILADETKIDVTSLEYSLIKEKVIGRVFNFKLEADQILPQLLNVYKTSNPGYFKWLTDWTSYISNLLKEYKQHNLRTIKFFFESLEKIYDKINDVDKKYQKEVIIFSLTICIEFKAGNIQSNEVNQHRGLDDFSKNYYANVLQDAMDSHANKEITRKKEYAEVFFENYLMDRKDDFHFYPSIFGYILSGFLEKEMLTEELKNREPEIMPESKIAYSKLINYRFRELENKEFAELVTSVEDFSRKGEYSIYDYSLIAEFYFLFSKNALVNITNEQIKIFLKEGIAKAALRKELNSNYLDHLLHTAPHNTEVYEIREEIKQAHYAIEKDEFTLDSAKLASAIKVGDIESLRRIFDENFLIGKLFKFLVINDLASAIEKAPNSAILELDILIRKRYNSVNIGEFLGDEVGVLIELENKLKPIIANCNGQPRKFVLSSLLDTIVDSRIHTESTRKSQIE